MLAAAALAGLLLIGLVAQVLSASREAYDRRARATVTAVVTIAQRVVGEQLARVDASLQATEAELALLRRTWPGDEGAVTAMLDRQRRTMPGVDALLLTDASGQVRWTSGGRAAPTGSIAGEAWYRAAHDRPAAAALGGPLPPTDGSPGALVLARAAQDIHGVTGVLVARLAATHFERVFAGFDMDAQAAISLRTGDLHLVARHTHGADAEPAVAPPRDEPAPAPPLRAALAADPRAGVFVARHPVDGIERTTAYRRVEGWPLLMMAGVGNERFFAPWRDQAWQTVGLAVGAWLLFVAALAAAYRAWVREAQRSRELADQTRHTQALLRVAADGIHIVDGQGRLVALSDSFAAMLGEAPQALLGRHVSSWDMNQDESRIAAWLAQVQPGDRQRVEVQHRHADGHAIDVELQLSVADIGGERLVFASARDITERKRLQAEIDASSQRIRDLYDQAPCGYHSLDAEGRLVEANATLLDWLGRPAAEVIGRARLADFLDAADRERFEQAFARLRADGRIDGLELSLQPRTGPPREVSLSTSAVRDADGRFLRSRSVALDISAQVRAWREAQRLMHEQAAMLDNDLVPMIKLCEDRLLWKNRALDRLFGYAPGELDGQPLRRLHLDDAGDERIRRVAAQLRGGQHHRTLLPMRHADGRTLWIDLSGVLLAPGLTFWMMVDVTPMKEAQARIEHLAFHDVLTGLPNRLLLTDRLRQSLQAARRTGTRLAVCYLDLDGFKQVNDAKGHDAGDTLLATIGERLQAALRGNDTAARVGGDEFVLVLTLLEGADASAQPVVQRIAARIRQPVRLADGSEVAVDTSVGVCLAPHGDAGPAQLITLADQALLRAKRRGKGQVEVVAPLPAEAAAAGTGR
ncbi:sensory box/GGDEF family protein [Piscinibacter sakaiensis]|uniref:Sensory box/GGDEF family protein n=2 Tax=Piscinibacter sakaiensis TaxID=1547922 RepID=A0A0K8NU18_PISS1|nr:sensory box/GGDEF family protein [Piscinibacter sakaiensis]